MRLEFTKSHIVIDIYADEKSINSVLSEQQIVLASYLVLCVWVLRSIVSYLSSIRLCATMCMCNKIILAECTDQTPKKKNTLEAYFFALLHIALLTRHCDRVRNNYSWISIVPKRKTTNLRENFLADSPSVYNQCILLRWTKTTYTENSKCFRRKYRGVKEKNITESMLAALWVCAWFGVLIRVLWVCMNVSSCAWADLS